ncbi:MAG: hypothetical protein J5910_10025 [Lachnospiraceae bacterium]|nr:hypothetical protein [Lachnospiraceae bacterium]
MKVLILNGSPKPDGNTAVAINEMVSKYEAILDGYKEKLNGYSHKDQKPYWH